MFDREAFKLAIREAIREEIAAALPEAIATAIRKAMEPPKPLTASEAAKRVRCRMDAIVKALRSGALAGKFDHSAHGGKGRWSIDVIELDRWVAARKEQRQL